MKRNNRLLNIVFCLLVAGAISGCSGEESATQTREHSLQTETVFVDEGFESQHPYPNNSREEWILDVPSNAVSVTVHFGRVETEPFFDYISIFDQTGEEIHRLTGNRSNESFTVEGPVLRILLYSDHSIRRWGFEVLNYQYDIPAGEQQPKDRRPYCGAIGTKSEGWYWRDTDELIKYAMCADSPEPYCGAIGSRSEGWYSPHVPAMEDGDLGVKDLIVWDFCRFVEGIAVAGETCGGDSGFECYEEWDLYCAGATETEPGVCLWHGSCRTVEDCLEPGNIWIRPACVGYAGCSDENTCTWTCDGEPIEMGVWSWTTVAVASIESDHPYANNFDHTWTIHKPGASKIKVHFPLIDVEYYFDWIEVSGDYSEEDLILTGYYTNYWTPEIEGDTAYISLVTDYSVRRWGFKVDKVSYYELLPPGVCNRTEDCNVGYECIPNECSDPYSPCYGECWRDESCDDGTEVTCKMLPPICGPGTILAHQDSCYRCVDPETCEAPAEAGSEGSPCSMDSHCIDGLFCKNIINGEGSCRGELWCAPETVEADCADAIHPAIPGYWVCPDSTCAWHHTMVEQHVMAQDTPIAIPDNNPAGITSTLHVSNMIACDMEILLDFDISHTYIGDLIVGLRDPHGTRVIIANRYGGSSQNLVVTGLDISDYIGKNGVTGTWTLDVSDHAWLDTGTLNSWGLRLSCQ